MATIDDKDKKIGEVPHLEQVTGKEKIPVSANGEPRYVELGQIRDGLLGEEKASETYAKVTEDDEHRTEFRIVESEGGGSSAGGESMVYDVSWLAGKSSVTEEEFLSIFNAIKNNKMLYLSNHNENQSTYMQYQIIMAAVFNNRIDLFYTTGTRIMYYRIDENRSVTNDRYATFNAV